MPSVYRNFEPYCCGKTKHMPYDLSEFLLTKMLGSIDRKLLPRLADFGFLGGGGGLSESVKKEKFGTKIFFC